MTVIGTVNYNVRIPLVSFYFCIFIFLLHCMNDDNGHFASLWHGWSVVHNKTLNTKESHYNTNKKVSLSDANCLTHEEEIMSQ